MKFINHDPDSKCSEKQAPVMSFQVTPHLEYDSTKGLCVLWVCPECGAYELERFDDYKRRTSET